MKHRMNRLRQLRIRKDTNAVSEIIANILILVMTVSLFSSVFIFVGSFPAPQDRKQPDFLGTLEKVGSNYYLNITNKGGNVLQAWKTSVYVTINSVTTGPLAFSNSNVPIGDSFTIGEVWAWTFTSIPSVKSVYVQFYDKENSGVMWASEIKVKQFAGPYIFDTGTNPSTVISFYSFIFYAEIFDTSNGVDTANTYVNLASIGLSSKILLTYDINTNRYETINLVTTITDGLYPAQVTAKDFAGNMAFKNITVTVSTHVVSGKPDLTVLFPTDIRFSSDSPARGDAITISAVISNIGSVAAQSSDISFWDTNKLIFIKSGVSVPEYGQTTVYCDWIAQPGGLHTIYVNITNVSPTENNTGNNINSRTISVMPTILLVDDDGVSFGVSDDVVTYMETALQSCDFKYTLHTVPRGSDGPPYTSSDSTAHPLINYDVVIWMTGNTTSSTLTSHDQLNLATYLDNGGSLWLIGQSVLTDLKSTNSFVNSYLHVNSFNTSVSEPTSTIFGVNSNKKGPITSDILPLAIASSGRIIKRGDYITSVNGVSTKPLFNDSSAPTQHIVALSYNTTYRLVFFPWEFSEISDLGDQAIITYRMIIWLGNISLKSGNDVAVSSQTFTPTTPHFMDNVTLTAIVRNNGMSDLTNVRVVFRIDGVSVSTAPDGKPNPQTVNLAKCGGSAKVTKSWLPRTVGTHSFSVEVNPDRTNPPDETNYDNNMATGSLFASSIYLEYKILIVDADGSKFDSHGALDNKNGLPANPDVSDYMKTAINNCGLAGSYDEINVDYGGNGPSATRMINYTSVIWLTGNCTHSSGGTLNLYDMGQIMAYLRDNYTSVWLIGQGILNDTTVTGNTSFRLGHLRVNTWNSASKSLNPIYGMFGDEISNGMKIKLRNIFGTGYGVNSFVPTSDIYTNPIFMNNATSYWGSTSSYNGVRYNDPSGWRFVFQPWDFACINGGAVPEPNSGMGTTPLINATNQRTELAYMVLHWFGRIEQRPELRVTSVDLYYGNTSHGDIQFDKIYPIIGKSYVLKAKIWNVGGVAVDVIARFLDGNTEIQSTDVYVPASYTDPSGLVINGYSIAEIIWHPLFAGNETIRVDIDPDQVITNERFRFNNEVIQGTTVYFFYDNMENGDSLWKHESTIMRINGESPLEYFDPPANTVNTNVTYSWQAMSGFNLTSNYYFSYPYCYYMFEPKKTGPADVVIAFDSSNSMSGQPILDEQNAAIALMNMMTDDSRLAITYYAGSGNIKWYPATNSMWTLNTAGRAAALAAIQGVPSNAVTQVWDNIGTAYSYLYVLNHQMPTHMPVVVALTDGCDRNGNDATPFTPPPSSSDDNQMESGSNNWAPWDTYAAGNETYTWHFGKIGGTATTTGFWHNKTSFTGSNKVRRGLLSLNIPTFTIGLNLEHHDPPYLPATTTQPPVDVNDPTYAFYTNGKESGTVEYNLWRIANTSGAKYFYAPTSGNLLGIFTAIGTIIGGMSQSSFPGPITSSSGGNSVNAILIPKTYPSGANGDNYTLTKTIDLSGNIQSARIQFMQRYNLVRGANGVVIMVGTSVDNGASFKYRYVMPNQPYPGNLNTEYRLYDWNGNGGANDRPIEWAYNGKSANGQFLWEQATVDLTPYIGNQYVRVLFQYFYLGGGNNGSYMLDNVEVVISRQSSYSSPFNSTDQWQYVPDDSTNAHGGSGYWINHNPVSAGNDYLGSGLDDSLITQPIDLTSAKTPFLSAYFKFNINWGAQGTGRPPDGFRVEVSSDNGITWTAINKGVRSSWNVSGSETTHDGVNDGTSYTGITSSTDTAAGKLYWVGASTLYRLQTNLTGWRGLVILIRFRVVTNTIGPHYARTDRPGGIYLDDVIVGGQTVTSG